MWVIRVIYSLRVFDLRIPNGRVGIGRKTLLRLRANIGRFHSNGHRFPCPSCRIGILTMTSLERVIRSNYFLTLTVFGLNGVSVEPGLAPFALASVGVEEAVGANAALAVAGVDVAHVDVVVAIARLAIITCEKNGAYSERQ